LNVRLGLELGILTNAIKWIFLTSSRQILAEVNIRKDTNKEIKEAFNEYLSYKKACQQYINIKNENLSRFDIELLPGLYFVNHNEIIETSPEGLINLLKNKL
jgi:hypothetical protein